MLSSPLLVAIGVLTFVIYKFVIFPAFVSPLSRIPNAHPSAPFSSLWILWVRYQGRENRTVHSTHDRLGSVVRLSPNELSINCFDNGLRTVYAGTFAKPDYYPNLFTNYDGVPNMFSTIHNSAHAGRKRILTNVYSKSFLQSSPTMAAICQTIIQERFLPKVTRYAQSGSQLDIYHLFNATTMDLVTSYQLGLRNGSNFLENDDEAAWWLHLYHSRKSARLNTDDIIRRSFTFWPQELPGLTRFFKHLGIHLSPEWVSEANHKLEAWCLQMCDSAERYIDEPNQSEVNRPVVYGQLREGLRKQEQKQNVEPLSTKATQRVQIASELLDHLSAGHETSSITLTYLFHELAQRPQLQKSLHQEILTLTPVIRLKPTPEAPLQELPDPRSIDSLPLLHAVLMETLRTHPAIPGAQPRLTPMKPTTLGKFSNIPPNVRVSASAYSLHRNPQAFPNPEAFQPERWLESTSLENDSESSSSSNRTRHFWAFSSGGRMCIGSNLAMQQMKLVIVAFLSNFRVELPDENEAAFTKGRGATKPDPVSEDGLRILEQEDAYTAQPVAGRLDLRILTW